MATKKANVLLIGSGGVGTIAAVNLEAGGVTFPIITAKSIADFGSSQASPRFSGQILRK